VGVIDRADAGGLGECIDNPSPEGRLGMGMGMAAEGECGGEEGVTGNTRGGRVGDAGRLAKELVVGVLGVLDGLGPGSNGRVGKLLNMPPSLRDGSFDGGVVVMVIEEREPLALVLPPVGTEGTISHPPTSSSSSIDGKVCENSVKYDDEVCGDDDGEDVGDGGPRLDRGTKACGDGVVDVEFDDDVEGSGGTGKEGDKFEEAAEADTDMDEAKLEFEYRFRIASGETGGVGRLVGGGSRENRLLVAPTDRPASWRDRIRSAMLPPDLDSVLPLVVLEGGGRGVGKEVVRYMK
jgi:hypothetical protein